MAFTKYTFLTLRLIKKNISEYVSEIKKIRCHLKVKN